MCERYKYLDVFSQVLQSLTEYCRIIRAGLIDCFRSFQLHDNFQIIWDERRNSVQIHLGLNPFSPLTTFLLLDTRSVLKMLWQYTEKYLWPVILPHTTSLSRDTRFQIPNVSKHCSGVIPYSRLLTSEFQTGGQFCRRRAESLISKYTLSINAFLLVYTRFPK